MVARNLMKHSPFLLLLAPLTLILGACGETSTSPVATNPPPSTVDSPLAPTQPNLGEGVVKATEASAPAPASFEISHEEAYQRVLIYTAGASHIFQHTNAMLVDVEIERRKIAGMDLGSLKVTDAEIETEIERIISEAVEKNPDLDFWRQVKAMGYTTESFREEKRRHMTLVRLFFPPEPADWPMELLKEVFGNEGDNNLYDAWIAGIPAELLKKKEKGESYSLDNMTLQMFLLPHVMRWLYQQADIKEPFDGLREGVCLSVNGKEVPTSEMLKIVEPLLTPVVKERAAAWVEIKTKVGAALEAKNLLLTSAEAQALVDEDKKEFENSPISYEQIALQVMGFPTMEMFKQHYLLLKSHGQSLSNPLSTEELQAHLETRRQFLGNGKANAEVILFSALDLETGVFPDDADLFAVQESRAAEAAAKLEDGVTWEEILDEYSDYPESVVTSMPGAPQPKKGRLGNQSRNPLRQFLGENDYVDFLQGYSIGEAILFDAEIGQVYGPVRGPFGFYMYRVKDRIPPTKEFDLANDKNQVYVVSDDLQRRRFLAFVDQVMSAGAEK